MLFQKKQFRQEIETFQNGNMSLHLRLHAVCVHLALVIGLKASFVVSDLAVNQGRT